MGASSISSQIEARSFADLSRTQLLLALTGMVLTLLTAAMNQALGGTAMPRAVADLNGFARYPWPTTSHLLTSTIAMPVFAKLSDLYGRKWLYVWSTVIFVVSLLLCGAAGNLPVPLDGMNQLIVARGLLGVGNGAIIALTLTLVADLFSPSERGRYQGIMAAVFGVAFTVGPPLGGWVTDHLSWRWAYYVDVPLGVLAIVVVYLTLPDIRPQHVRRLIDWAGIAALCGWIVPLLLALTWVGQSGWSAPRIRELLIASAVLLAAFLMVEKRAVEPVLVLSLFRDRRISLMSLNFFLMGIGLFGVAVYLPLFVQGVLGASAARSGLVLAQLTLAMLAGNLVGGQLLSRTGRYNPLAISGAGLAASGLFLMSQMDGTTTQLSLLRNAIICGIGFGVLTPTYEVLVQNAAPKEQLGVATGFTQFARTIGGTIGLALFGTILLRLYHAHVDPMIPPGTPKALTQVFDNPLQLVFTRPNLGAAFSQISNGRVLLSNLLDGVRVGLLSALHSVFLYAAGIMAVTFTLSLFLREVPPQKER
jgi:EmrB/QacA subfamily drug resistance transporter